MQDCSRNATWLLCSNNVKSQPNLNFYILLSDKNRRWGWRWLQAIFVRHNSIKDFVLLASWSAVCKGSEFLQFCEKIQSNMHQIFSQMCLTVSIGPSHMDSSTELFIKKLFRWSPQFSSFDSPNKNLSNRYMSFKRPAILPESPETTLRNTWTQALITNVLSFIPPQ